MRFRTVFLFVIFAMLALTSCSKDDEGYRFPLKLGNSWTYHRVFEITTGSNTQTFVDTIRIEVDSILQNNGDTIIPEHLGINQVYRLRIDEHDTNGNLITNYQFVANAADGLYYYGAIGSGYGIYKGMNRFSMFAAGQKPRRDSADDIRWFQVPHLLMPKNPKTGYTWVQPEDGDWLEVHYEMLAPQTLQTEAGSMKCFVKRSELSSFPDDELKHHYSSKGLVRGTYSASNAVYVDGKYVTETIEDNRILIAYDLK